jgi:tetratricopeptide (TPR) repeat protein
LIRARDDRHLWSEKYERDLTDVLVLQGEVARAIAAQVRTQLSLVDRTNPARNRKVDPEGYEAFLKGNFFLHSGLRGIAKSLEWFDHAIECDPSNSGAHSGRAEALVYASIFELRPPAEALLEARISAQAALKLDPSNGAAHNVIADVKKGYDWDLAAAEAEYQRALELNPNQVLTRTWYAECLDRMGRTDQSLAESQRAVALDPVSALTHANRAMLLFRARRFQEAIQEGQQSLDLDPNLINAYWWQGLAYAGTRDFASAVDVLTKAAGLSDAPLLRASLGYVYALLGDRPRALGVLRQLEALSKERYVSPVDFAQVYAGLDDADSTFQWLEKAYEARDGRVHQLPQPYFDGVRGDPRYATLMKRIGLSAR